MSVEGQKFYPGETASPQEVLALAGEYRRAADALFQTGGRGQTLPRAPYRLIAIHATELYLNAFLLSAGIRPAELRSLQHNFGRRSQMAQDAKLNLRNATFEHLRKLDEHREYLVARYEPGGFPCSELTRISATLNEIAVKVAGHIDRKCRQPTD